ncbi:hypothetical protein BJV74DRAFT_507734 [Russula compacta]|nr:hypothetical protein BJV74DRAFT_507734 [Russula compacta]
MGEGISHPVPLVKTIHTGIGALLSAIKDVSASYDALVDLLESICSIFERLDIYTKLPPTPVMNEIIIKVLVQLISTLAVATKQIKQGRLKKFGKKLLGDKEVEDVLHRMDEGRTAAARTLENVHGLFENLRWVMGRPTSTDS